ncbi:MAG: 1-(5-phosphoribosyl)-5-[(5-phosphoribosylamino)methylideneamino]imidazole-4-carboxamide isomerase [Ferrimicrobium sp.]
MNLLAAIDVLDGRSTRLSQGDFERATVYDAFEDALERVVEAGALQLHVVDLSGARNPLETHNRSRILAALGEVDAWVEFGGGIRDSWTVETLLASGVDRVVVGTKAVIDREFRSELAQFGSGRIAIALDYRLQALKRMVAISGWAADSDCELGSTIEELVQVGLSVVLVTDISRDGMFTGPDIATYQGLIDTYPIQLIASGGVRAPTDIVALAGCVGSIGSIESVVVGKAIHEGRISVKEAIEACQTSA